MIAGFRTNYSREMSYIFLYFAKLRLVNFWIGALLLRFIVKNGQIMPFNIKDLLFFRSNAC